MTAFRGPTGWNVVALPGFDGSSVLSQSFALRAPQRTRVTCLDLLPDWPADHRELVGCVQPLLPDDPVVLVAQSFSGPLAILLAERCPNVAGVVLCASFARAPIPPWMAPLPGLWMFEPPAWAIAWLLTGGDCAIAAAVQDEVTRIGRATIARRMKALARVDVTAELARCTRPLLYIRATRDRVVSAREPERMRALQPALRVVDVDAPHLVLQARPVEAWRAVTPFLEEIARAVAARDGG